MNELTKLARKWGTDKALYYAEYYDSLLSPRREFVRKVLEIGIGDPKTMLASVARMKQRSYITGASLQMWEEYFPNACIYGLDYNQEILFNRGRIRCFYLDQGDPESYDAIGKWIGKDFDLIIDDGSHIWPQQILCAQKMVPLLRDGGIYIIEDCPMNPAFLMDLGAMPYEVKDFVSNPLDPARVVVIRK